MRYNNDGSIDKSFGLDGIVITDINRDDDYGRAVSIQSDGKIVLAGWTKDFLLSKTNFAVVRYNTNGSLDNTFRTNGIVDISFGSNDAKAYTVAIQNDGKIVVAGYYGDGRARDIAMARLNVDGSLDTSFDSDGLVITNIYDLDYAESIALQSDGKIIIAGMAGTNFEPDYLCIVRYNINGSLDNTFDEDGIITVIFGIGGYSRANSVIVQNDGKIIVTGYAYNVDNMDFVVARYNANGGIDNSFGTNSGYTLITFGDGYDHARCIKLQSDGKIVVTGQCYINSKNNIALARLNTNGFLDSSFGVNGKVITSISNDDYGYSSALFDDNKIIVAGYSNNGKDNDFFVARYLLDNLNLKIKIFLQGAYR